MSKRKTKSVDVLMAIDASGSMYGLADDVRGGFNQYLDELAADEDTAYRITATLFNTRVWPLRTEDRLSAVPRLDGRNYQPMGGTALYDAIGQLITAVDSEADRQLVVVHTDGFENSSLEWTLPAIRKLIQSKDANRWGFVFLGADPEAWKQGDTMGFFSAQTVNTAGGTRGTYSGLGAGTRSYAGGGSAQSVTKTAAETSAAFHKTHEVVEEDTTDGE